MRFFIPVGASEDSINARVHHVKLLTTAGFNVIVSLKFDLRDKGRPGLKDRKFWAERTRKIVTRLGGSATTMTIGNEPWVDSPKNASWGEVFSFHQEMARVVRAVTKEQENKTTLYLGAINRYEREETIRGEQHQWIDFANETHWLRGVDIHPHLATPSAYTVYAKLMRERLAPDKCFLMTEFSVIHWYLKHMKKPLRADIADAARMPRGSLNWEFIRKAGRSAGMPQELWTRWQRSCPWYYGTRSFMRDCFTAMDRTDQLTVATWGMTQPSKKHKGKPSGGLTEGARPWSIDDLFAPALVSTPGGRNVFQMQQFLALIDAGHDRQK